MSMLGGALIVAFFIYIALRIEKNRSEEAVKAYKEANNE